VLTPLAQGPLLVATVMVFIPQLLGDGLGTIEGRRDLARPGPEPGSDPGAGQCDARGHLARDRLSDRSPAGGGCGGLDRRSRRYRPRLGGDGHLDPVPRALAGAPRPPGVGLRRVRGLTGRGPSAGCYPLAF
jgi:hypothetical protein